MARMQIPVHVEKTEKGEKVLTSKKKLDELGVNAYVVSAGTLKKLDDPPPLPKVVTKTKTVVRDSNLDLEAMAKAACLEVAKLPGCYVPAGLEGAILRGLQSKA